MAGTKRASVEPSAPAAGLDASAPAFVASEAAATQSVTSAPQKRGRVAVVIVVICP